MLSYPAEITTITDHHTLQPAISYTCLQSTSYKFTIYLSIYLSITFQDILENCPFLAYFMCLIYLEIHLFIFLSAGVTLPSGLSLVEIILCCVSSEHWYDSLVPGPMLTMFSVMVTVSRYLSQITSARPLSPPLTCSFTHLHSISWDQQP